MPIPKFYRRGRDSTPGSLKRDNGFRDRPVQPLRHLSVMIFIFLIKYTLYIRQPAPAPFRKSIFIFYEYALHIRMIAPASL